MLEIRSLKVKREEFLILNKLSFSVHLGEVVSLIGSNGAGKTTLVEAILGKHKIISGSIHWNGASILGQFPHEIARKQIAWVPEGRRIFPDLTVKENLDVAVNCQDTKMHYTKNMEWVLALFPVLKDRLKQSAGLFSGGEQQMLAMARALMSNPKLLLIDEMSMGLAPKVIEQVFSALKSIREQKKMGMLLVEQNVLLALKNSDRALVLDQGKIVREGKSESMIGDEWIRKTYLGSTGTSN